MIVEYVCFSVLFAALLAAAVFDWKSGIVPDGINLLLLVNGIIFGLYKGYSFTEFLFYLFIVSVPLLLISCLTDISMKLLRKKKISFEDYIVLAFFVLSLPAYVFIFDIKTAFVVSSLIFLAPFVYSLIMSVFTKRFRVEKEAGKCGIAETDQQACEEEEEYSIGGGDLKLFAVLGLHFGARTIPVSFWSFVLSLIFAVLFRKKRINLAPFIFISSIYVFISNKL